MKARGPKRSIVKKMYFFGQGYHRGAIPGMVSLLLDCGHKREVPYSQEPKEYCFCQECLPEYMRAME